MLGEQFENEDCFYGAWEQGKDKKCHKEKKVCFSWVGFAGSVEVLV